MNEMTIETMDIIDGLREMRFQQKVNAAKIGDKDKYGYAFEYSDSFGTDTLKFQETAMMLEIEANETFKIMREINRHSPLYFQMCAQLEKLISQLGSVCITKAVKEQQEGETFKLLERLTIQRLREMTAFNFRKCYQSFLESQAALVYNASALGFSIRWSALDKRLLATEEKIEKIKTGKLKIDISAPQEKLADQLKDQAEAADASAAGKTAAESAQESAPEPSKKTENPAAFVSKGRAFSVDKSSFGNADVRISKADSEPEKDQADVNDVQSAAEVVPAAVNTQPEQKADEKDQTKVKEVQVSSETVPAAVDAQPKQADDENNQLPAAVERKENNEEAEISGAEEVHSEAEIDDFSIEDPDEIPEVESAADDECETDTEEDLPFVSEELVRKMSAYCNSPEFLQQLTWPVLEYAKLPP
ncbi:MAG: hypothetical protein IJI41_05045 [Anaerolineaceae bacterium]|nr:hypothetical protein [Anaerolineaceae bacterium]